MSPARSPSDEQQLALALESGQGDRAPTAVTVAPAGFPTDVSQSSDVQPITVADLEALTPNELRLLQQAALGLTDKQIAHAAQRSYRTVQTQMRILRHKLRMRTRFQLGFHARAFLNRGNSSA